MKTSHSVLRSHSGFTLAEIMIAATISVIAIGCVLSTFIVGIRTMYKDSQRLATNTSLRQFLAHISKNSLDSTEYYLFPNYTALDGSVDLSTTWPPSNLAQPAADAFGTNIAQGDCLVLVTRLTTDPAAKIRWVRIYYSGTTTQTTQAPVFYYEHDYGTSGTSSTINTLLNAIVLSPVKSSSTRQLVDLAIGRKQGSNYYPVFSTETPGTTATQGNVAINMEIINGTTPLNMLSSSSLNYIISPRK